jgi:predicted dehydrogenase
MNPSIDRRVFLRDLSLASAGAALGAVSLSPRAHARVPGANDRIRVAIVGFSDRLKDALLPAFKNVYQDLNCEIVGVSDIWRLRREESVGFISKMFGVTVPTYRNNEELYEKGKPDAVIVSTADFQHALHCAEGVRAGCDVYCEKPFAETMADAREALKAVRSSDRIVQIGSQRRSGSNYHNALAYLKSGKFGDIVFAEMIWNVNQPGRWRRPAVVPLLKEADTDWGRYQMNRPKVAFDPRKYLEFRLFWPYSSGIPGQWMCHQIDTVHWFTGLPHPRSVSASGGIYMWKDGRTNFDTLTAVLDYGPLNDKSKGFQVTFSSRFSNSAGGTKEIYYSNGGELNLDTNQITPNGGLEERYAKAMNLKANKVEPASLKTEGAASTAANTGADKMTTAHMRNWLECVRSRKQPNAPVEAGYQHTIACVMANAAARTGEKVTFDEKTQEVMAGGKVFHL